MTDELKAAETDVPTALKDLKIEMGKLEVYENTTGAWVKAHWVVIAGAGGFILGFATRFIHL